MTCDLTWTRLKRPTLNAGARQCIHVQRLWFTCCREDREKGFFGGGVQACILSVSMRVPYMSLW